MDDKYRIDSNKLRYHPDRISQWLEDPLNTYPIYIEISPTSHCNHRCVFCAFDYIGYEKIFLDKDILMKTLSEMAVLGIKSVMYGGEGEPLLNKNLSEIINHAKDAGIDEAITTNGVALSQRFCQKTLSSLSWVKVSINAGTKETYSKIHRCPFSHFDIVLRNLLGAVKIKKKNNYECDIGAQMILLPENHRETVILARKLKEIGVDYFVVKPYSQHNMSINRKDIDYDSYLYLEKELQEIADEKFSIIFRKRTMDKLKEEHYFSKCLAVPFFWAHIDAKGDVWSCGCFMSDSRFFLGNICRQSFREIWQGELRKKHIEFVSKELDISECRKNCRMNDVNRYLWDQIHLPRNVNFI